MLPVRRALPALAVGVLSLAVATLPAGPVSAAETGPPFTFSPAAPSATPSPSPTDFVTASTPGDPACSIDGPGPVDIGVTYAGYPIDWNATEHDTGAIEVYFTPYTPGTYVVTATCGSGDDQVVLTGSVQVGPPTSGAAPTLTTSTVGVPAGTFAVTATGCTDQQGGMPISIMSAGPTATYVQESHTAADGTYTAVLGPYPSGTYTVTGLCADPSTTDDTLFFVYPEQPTVVLGAGLGDPEPTVPGHPRPGSDGVGGDGRARPATGVAATPRFTG